MSKLIHLSIVVGRHHPFVALSEGVTLKDVEEQSLALLTNDFATRAYVNAYFQKHKMTPKVAIQANTISAIVEIVSRGNMVTILPDAIVQENHALSAIALIPSLPSRSVALLRRKDAYQSAASLAFTVLIKSMMKETL